MAPAPALRARGAMLLPSPLVPITPCKNAPFACYLKPYIRSFCCCSHAPAPHPCLLMEEVSGKCIVGFFLGWGKVSCTERHPRALELPVRQISLRVSAGHCKATALSSLMALGKLFLPVYALVCFQKSRGAKPLARKGWCCLFPGTRSPSPFPGASQSGCPTREESIRPSQEKAMSRTSNAPRGFCGRACPWPWGKAELETPEPHGPASWDHLPPAPFL